MTLIARFTLTLDLKPRMQYSEKVIQTWFGCDYRLYSYVSVTLTFIFIIKLNFNLNFNTNSKFTNHLKQPLAS